MKRRTFLQTVVGAIMAVFMPKATANTTFKPPLKEGEQNPDGQLCLISDAEQRPNTRVVRYVGQKKIKKGSLVYYVDELRRDVTDRPLINYWVETEFEFAGVVKATPEQLQTRYTVGPSFKTVPLVYEESLNA